MAQDDMVVIPIPVSSGGSSGGGMAVPQLSPQAKAELIDKIKPEAMVEVIRQRLLGREWNATKKEWLPVPALKDRKLSEIGAWEISNLMLGVSSINISVSKLNDKKIRERLFRIARSAQKMMISNWKLYGITNTAQFHYVHEIVFSNTMGVLEQAGDGSIQELLKATVYEQRNITAPQKEQGGQKLSRMLGLKD